MTIKELKDFIEYQKHGCNVEAEAAYKQQDYSKENYYNGMYFALSMIEQKLKEEA